MAEGYKDWSAGDILTAADLEDYTVKQSVMRFADSSARTTALSGVLAEGMMSYLKDTDSVEVYDGSGWAAVAGGKILQVVTGTTSTAVATTAGTMVTTGLTATITPTAASSDILVLACLPFTITAASTFLSFTLFRGTIASGTNLASPNPQLGQIRSGTGGAYIRHYVTTVALDSPATTSATTYTAAFNSGNAEICRDSNQPATMFLMEVSA